MSPVMAWTIKETCPFFRVKNTFQNKSLVTNYICCGIWIYLVYFGYRVGGLSDVAALRPLWLLLSAEIENNNHHLLVFAVSFLFVYNWYWLFFLAVVGGCGLALPLPAPVAPPTTSGCTVPCCLCWSVIQNWNINNHFVGIQIDVIFQMN